MARTLNAPKSWSSEEDALIHLRLPEKGAVKFLAAQLGRSKGAILARARRIGASANRTTEWTPAREKILREIYVQEGCSARLKKMLGLSSLAIYGRVRKLGLRHTNTFWHGKTGDKNPNYKGHKDISWTYFSNLIDGAKERGIIFDLTIQDAWQLYEDQDRRCKLSNLPIVFRKNHLDKTANASLDRIDSTKNYTKSNVQWVHKDINQMKWDFTPTEFVEYCRLVAKHNPL